MTGRRQRALAAAALVLLVAPLALAARWRWAAAADGRQLRPRPDALEYAAAAQAIAAEGRYYLQVGPYRVRPRYPPGWPLVLAGAVRLGVPGDRLWMVTGLFGAGLSCLLALAAASAVWRLGGQAGGRAAGGAFAAGLVAGAGWALAPAAVAVGRVALADEPAASVAALFVLGTALAARTRADPSEYRPPDEGRPKPSGPAADAAAPGKLVSTAASTGRPPYGRPASGGWAAGGRAGAALGGVSFGLLAAMRPASALLLAPAAVVFAAYAWRSHGARGLLRRAVPWGAGAAVVPLVVAGLLWRSQLPPWQWSGYGFWVPRWYADAGTTFNLRYALHGNADFPRGSGGRPISHLRFYAQVLLGWPGLAPDSYLGLGWPALGWAAGLLLAWRQRRHPAVAAGTLAAGAVIAAHLAFYSLYFFPAARFLLAPLALPLAGAAVACGLGIAGPRAAPAPARASQAAGSPADQPPRPAAAASLAAGLAGAAGAAGLAAAVAAGFLAFTAVRSGIFPDSDARAAFAAWRQLPETARAASTMPFDPVEAQALGLLPPAVLRQLGAWGALPATVHVRRLRGLGIIPGQPAARPAAGSLRDQPPGLDPGRP